MTDITLEQRARELLAAELDANARAFTARQVRAGSTDLGEWVSIPLRAIEAALRLSAGADLVCVWTEQSDGEAWDGGCGAMWQFTHGGPEDNDMHYCPRCGNRVEVAAAPRHETGEVDRG